MNNIELYDYNFEDFNMNNTYNEKTEKTIEYLKHFSSRFSIIVKYCYSLHSYYDGWAGQNQKRKHIEKALYEIEELDKVVKLFHKNFYFLHDIIVHITDEYCERKNFNGNKIKELLIGYHREIISARETLISSVYREEAQKKDYLYAMVHFWSFGLDKLVYFLDLYPLAISLLEGKDGIFEELEKTKIFYFVSKISL